MAKLSTHLRYYVRKKVLPFDEPRLCFFFFLSPIQSSPQLAIWLGQVRDDPLWKGIKVIYSGHEVPGEGEHKIIKYIRHRKAQADWNPGERHCM